MAFFKSYRSDVLDNASFDPHELSSPQVFLLSMLVFLAIVGFIAAILYRQISYRLHHQSRPQRAHPGGAGGRHPARLQPGRQAVSRGPLGQLLPRRQSEATEPVLLAPMKALLSRSSAVALSTLLDAHHAGFDRHPPRREPRHLALPDRPFGVPRPARHVLGPARHDRLDRRDHPGRSTPARATQTMCWNR